MLLTDSPDIEDGPDFGELYGPLKALCEQEAEKGFPGRATIIRAGLIVGVGDPTDRYSYWPVRIERGGEVLAPPEGDPVQFIDARDLGEWTIRCVEDGTYGVFNTIGPATRFTVRQMLEGIGDTIKSNATFTYTTSKFLWAQRPAVRGWAELPVWIAPEGSYGALEGPHDSALRRHGQRDDRVLQGADARAASSVASGVSRPSVKRKCSPPGTRGSTHRSGLTGGRHGDGCDQFTGGDTADHRGD